MQFYILLFVQICHSLLVCFYLYFCVFPVCYDDLRLSHYLLTYLLTYLLLVLSAAHLHAILYSTLCTNLPLTIELLLFVFLCIT